MRARGRGALTRRPRLRGYLAAVLAAAMLGSLAAAATASDAQRVARVLAQSPLIDGHNDLRWEIRERFGGDLTKFDFRASTLTLPVPAGAVRPLPPLRQGVRPRTQ